MLANLLFEVSKLPEMDNIVILGKVLRIKWASIT